MIGSISTPVSVVLVSRVSGMSFQPGGIVTLHVVSSETTSHQRLARLR